MHDDAEAGQDWRHPQRQPIGHLAIEPRDPVGNRHAWNVLPVSNSSYVEFLPTIAATRQRSQWV
jgi:hypothetical protein